MPSSGSGAATSAVSPSSDYTTLANAKARLGIQTADTADDAILAAIITAVSRMIDTYCGRRFYAATETRYFTATNGRTVLVDDLLSVSALATDDNGDRTYATAWATTDYDLYPANAALDDRAYWRIDLAPNGLLSFPCYGARGIRVTGTWGAASTPAEVSEACLFQVALNYAAKDAPGGTRSGGDFSTQINAVGLHPFCRQLLNPLRRVSVG